MAFIFLTYTEMDGEGKIKEERRQIDWESGKHTGMKNESFEHLVKNPKSSAVIMRMSLPLRWTLKNTSVGGLYFALGLVSPSSPLQLRVRVCVAGKRVLGVVGAGRASRRLHKWPWYFFLQFSRTLCSVNHCMFHLEWLIFWTSS